MSTGCRTYFCLLSTVKLWGRKSSAPCRFPLLFNLAYILCLFGLELAKSPNFNHISNLRLTIQRFYEKDFRCSIARSKSEKDFQACINHQNVCEIFIDPISAMNKKKFRISLYFHEVHIARVSYILTNPFRSILFSIVVIRISIMII